MQPFLRVLFLLFIVPVQILSQNPVDAGSVVGKVICGYQGWFNCFGDGSPVASWRHWTAGQYQSNTPNPAPGNVRFEVYPDVTSYGEGQLFQTSLANLGDGRSAKLFSSYKNEVIDQHFAWMEQNGIDGVALQRFIAETFDGVFKSNRDTIAARVKRAAEKHHRIFYMMYDVSGLGDTQFDLLKSDWSNTMVGQLHLTASSAYAHQNGKPVVCLWGPGFTHVAGTAAQWLDLINWFKAQGCYVIGGTPTHWRNGVGDSKPGFENVYKAYDMLSPWTVGRFGNELQADEFRDNLIAPDLDYCTANNIAYQPVMFPGFAWSNWNGGSRNEIPRDKGNFFWHQAYNIRQLNIPSAYVAMFDEYDEATAIAPAADSYLSVPADQYFLTNSADGTYLSADFYLRLTGKLTKVINNSIPNQLNHGLENSNGPVWFRTSVETGYDAVPNWVHTLESSTYLFNLSGNAPGGIPRCAISNSRAHTGLSSIRFNGYDNDSIASSGYYKVFDVNIPVLENAYLSFWTFPENELSRHVTVDFVMTDGTSLRNSSATDANGVSMHPGAVRGTVNQWNQTVCKIGDWLQGKTIDRILLGYDYSPGIGSLSGFVDDISIYTADALSNTWSPERAQTLLPIKIFPNPADADVITVDMTHITGSTAILQLFDAMGKRRLQTTLQCGVPNQVTITGLDNGVYLASISGSKFLVSEKLIRQ